VTVRTYPTGATWLEKNDFTSSARCTRNISLDLSDGEDRYRELGSEKSVERNLATGIIWTRYPAEERLSWYDALAYCEFLTLEGYDDWQLPDINELRSIATLGKEPPDARVFRFLLQFFRNRRRTALVVNYR
jgi:hypothetical protein